MYQLIKMIIYVASTAQSMHEIPVTSKIREEMRQPSRYISIIQQESQSTERYLQIKRKLEAELVKPER